LSENPSRASPDLDNLEVTALGPVEREIVVEILAGDLGIVEETVAVASLEVLAK
jgi:hypothetical protein